MSDFAAVTDPKLKLEGMIRDLRAFNPKKVTWEEGNLREDIADELERIIQQHYGGEPKPANKYPWPFQDPARFNIDSADRWIEISDMANDQAYAMKQPDGRWSIVRSTEGNDRRYHIPAPEGDLMRDVIEELIRRGRVQWLAM